MNNHRIKAAVTLFLIFSIIIVAFLYLLRPIADLDFFWHLKTGEWIWENQSLPSKDPFSFTTPAHTSYREHFVLTSYWLSQIILYLFYLVGGMGAIVGFRFLIVGMLIYFLLKLREGDKIVYLGLLLIFLVVFLVTFPIERPQVFSFVFFAMLLYLLASIRTAASAKRSHQAMIFVPLLMFVWSNSHGGYVLGQATIVLFMALEGLKFIHPRLNPMTKGSYRALIVAGISGLIFSLLNPNTYHGVAILFSLPPSIVSLNVEYQTTLYFFRRFNALDMPLYWFLLLLTFVVLVINLKRPDITEIALLAGTGYFSFTQVRYIPFFLIAALPVVGRHISQGALLKAGRVLILFGALYAGVFFAWGERRNVQNLISGNWLTEALPVHAAEFILATHLRGAMYNHYNFGGYLIWKLAPERKVFIDGRGLNPEIISTAALIDLAYAENFAGMPFWKAMMEAFGVKYVVAPPFLPSGELYPLLDALLHDDGWRPVFFNSKSFIFVKDSEENIEVIKKYAVYKDSFIDGLIWMCDSLIKANPQNMFAYISKGDLYVKKARFRDARDAYERALQVSPANSTAAAKLRLLHNLYGM